MATTTVHFEDKGQGFLRWAIRDGVVIESDMQGWIWEGCKVTAEPMVGQPLHIEHPKAGKLVMRYKVTSIETNQGAQA